MSNLVEQACIFQEASLKFLTESKQILMDQPFPPLLVRKGNLIKSSGSSCKLFIIHFNMRLLLFSKVPALSSTWMKGWCSFATSIIWIMPAGITFSANHAYSFQSNPQCFPSIQLHSFQSSSLPVDAMKEHQSFILTKWCNWLVLHD